MHWSLFALPRFVMNKQVFYSHNVFPNCLLKIKSLKGTSPEASSFFQSCPNVKGNRRNLSKTVANNYPIIGQSINILSWLLSLMWNDRNHLRVEKRLSFPYLTAGLPSISFISNRKSLYCSVLMWKTRKLAQKRGEMEIDSWKFARFA
jgi:hypothetical protein